MSIKLSFAHPSAISNSTGRWTLSTEKKIGICRIKKKLPCITNYFSHLTEFLNNFRIDIFNENIKRGLSPEFSIFNIKLSVTNSWIINSFQSI